MIGDHPDRPRHARRTRAFAAGVASSDGQPSGEVASSSSHGRTTKRSDAFRLASNRQLRRLNMLGWLALAEETFLESRRSGIYRVPTILTAASGDASFRRRPRGILVTIHSYARKGDTSSVGDRIGLGS